MKPTEWGPKIWYLIHSVAYNIDDDLYFNQYKNSYFQFYESLKSIIPCPICRGHFTGIMKKKDIYKCKTKNDLIIWTINKHNKVNSRLKKKNISIKTSNSIYKKVNNKTIYKALDILTFNSQMKLQLKSYKNFFESIRVTLPIKHLRHLYIKAMEKNNIKVTSHNSLVKWYINLGKYISKTK